MADRVTSSLAEAKILVMEGQKGDTGYSPQIEVLDITGGHKVQITYQTEQGQIQTQNFDVMDGTDGEPGAPGEPGSPGAPGFSPTVSVQDIAEPLPGGGTKVIGHTVTITDAAGAHTFNVMNGEDGEGGGSDYDPDEELAKSFQLTVSGTTVTLNDTAVNVSAAIQSARPVLFYTESGGEFTFFGVSGMDYETGEIRLTTLFDGGGKTVTLRPNGSTMTGTLENVHGGGAVSSVNGKTGAVQLGAEDVHALPADTPIPAAVTEQTVSGWGFTKNTGTYTKPSGGIPKSDLAADVQTSLGKADTALQEHQDISGKEDVTETVTMTAADTAVTLQENKFYVFPEMAALTITCPATGGPFAFRFTSGATATTLSLTGVIMPDDFEVSANTVYEINVYEGYGLAVSWEVSA